MEWETGFLTAIGGGLKNSLKQADRRETVTNEVRHITDTRLARQRRSHGS